MTYKEGEWGMLGNRHYGAVKLSSKLKGTFLVNSKNHCCKGKSLKAFKMLEFFIFSF